MAARKKPAKKPARAVARPVTETQGRSAVRRIRPTVDWVAQVDKAQLPALAQTQILSATHFYSGLVRLRDDFSKQVLFPPDQHRLPQLLTGTLVLPDGRPAKAVAVSMVRFVDGKNTSVPPSQATVTDANGHFIIRGLPSAMLSAKTEIPLLFRGANGTETRMFKVSQVEPLGIMGTIQLKLVLLPLPQSIVASLMDIVGALEEAQPETARPGTSDNPIHLRVGDGECAISFNHDLPVERYPYSVLVRLVEPRTSILTESLLLKSQAKFVPVTIYNQAWAGILGAQRSFSERVPVDQPISVDGFRDQIVGDVDGTISEEETVPMAGTLGLGYMLHLAQQWTSEGLSLGDLVYSLPLAPGEQQRLAVFEQRQTLSTVELESLDYDEQQRARQVSDSSTQSVFDSAFAESVRGSSHFATKAESSSWGVAGGIGAAIGPVMLGIGAGGGGGSSSSSGSSSNSLDGTRDYTSTAASHAHSSVEREAAARRHAQRTGMRLATSSDVEQVTTKVITNNNRIHALTIQYWEVLRHFSVTTGVQGVTLVCFVPLEVVRFLPAGVSYTLVESQVANRALILHRYGPVLKHADILRRWVPFEYRQGLSVLEEFASNPRAVPSFASATEDIINISLRGTFLPFENIYVTVMTRRGTRLGPVRMSGAVPPLPDSISDASHAFKSRTELVAELLSRRNAPGGIKISANITLPSSINPDDVVGFEVKRSFQTLHYQLAPAPNDPLQLLFGTGNLQFANPMLALFSERVSDALNGVTMTPTQLEQELSGPSIWEFSAGIPGPPKETYADNYIGAADRFALPADGYPIAARAVNPLLKFNQLLRIEALVQHVVRNTVTYSRAVWMSLTPEERAIMLEGFTIGVPAGGQTDPTQHVPLLNCIANQVLGFYGNSMIMPFNIPAEVAVQLDIGREGDTDRPFTTAEVQHALTQFHRTGFSPPVSHIAMPTRGVLGEAVLGSCPSAEKIDLTRFWNWQDSPIPQAADIAGSTLNKGSTLVGATAPSTLAGMPSLVNNINAPPADATAALQALINAQNTKDLPNITGMDQLATLQGKTLDTAEKARADALARAQTLASEGLNKAGEMMKAKADSEKASQQEKEKKQADAEKKQAEAEKTKSTQSQQAISDMQTKSANYLAVADSRTDQAAADAYAAQIIQEKFGPGGVSVDTASSLFSSYQKFQSGTSGPLTKGSAAFLKALGLS
jgi:hypothetical protein